MDRRTFLKGLVATAAGVLVPGHVAAEPERRVWALDQTMVAPVRHVHFVEQPWPERGCSMDEWVTYWAIDPGVRDHTAIIQYTKDDLGRFHVLDAFTYQP